MAGEFGKDYMRDLAAFLDGEEAAGKTIYPPKDLVFSALNLTPLSKVKVVILGQDPYPTRDEAHGLSFSVPEGIEQRQSVKVFLQN